MRGYGGREGGEGEGIRKSEESQVRRISIKVAYQLRRNNGNINMLLQSLPQGRRNLHRRLPIVGEGFDDNGPKRGRLRLIPVGRHEVGVLHRDPREFTNK